MSYQTSSFVKNHPTVTLDKSIELLEKYQEENGDIQEVLEFLSEEYANFVNAPADTSSKKKKKKAKIVKAQIKVKQKKNILR